MHRLSSSAIAATLALGLSLPGTAVAQEAAPAESAGGESAAPAAPAAKAEKDRIKSVQRRYFVRGGRFELSPILSVHVNDPFQNNLLVGAMAEYHIVESFGLQLNIFGSIVSSATESLKSVRAESEVNPLQSTLSMAATIDAAWAPIYGKFSLFADTILHFDFGITAGFGVVRTLDSGGLVAEANAKANIQPAGVFGFTSRLMLAEWIVFSFAVRDYLYQVKYGPEFVAASRGAGATISNFKQNVVLNFGVGFFLPFSNPEKSL